MPLSRISLSPLFHLPLRSLWALARSCSCFRPSTHPALSFTPPPPPRLQGEGMEGEGREGINILTPAYTHAYIEYAAAPGATAARHAGARTEGVNDSGSSGTARPAATAAGCPCRGNRTSLDLRVQRREFKFKQSGFKAVLNSDCLNSNSSLFTAWLDAPRESNAAAGSRSRRAGEPVLPSEPSFGRRMGGEGAYWSLEAGGRGPRSSESDSESDLESD